MSRSLPSALLLLALLILPLGAPAAQAADPMQGIPESIKQQMMLMTPETRQRVMALSPETRQTIFQVFAKHQRQSTITLRQLMHEIQSDFSAVLTGILTDNGELAAMAARRLADHRIPRGGMLPYLPADTVNDETLGVLTSMNEVVEGGALKIADAADKGDMAGAATHLSEIVGGCVSCHAIFRGIPGRSENVMDSPK
ncbi:hypothetical protein JCM17960_33400 [Magnetospira thiophila]